MVKNESKSLKSVKVFMKSQGSVFIILVLMCLAASVFTDKFFSPSNLSNVLTQSVTCGISALGMTFVILTGGIDLSVGGCIVFTATIGMKFLSEGTVNVVTAILMMLGLGILVGVFNGTLITILKMPSFIATLASSSVTAGLALYISMGKTIIGIPIQYSVIGLKKVMGLPVCVWMMFGLYILSYLILRRTSYGRKIYAAGSNRKSAWLSGINVRLVEFSVYVINGLMSALVGIVLTSKLLSSTSTIGNGMEVNSIAAVVIGGASMTGGEGSVIGTIVGALILTIISNAMNLMSVNAYLQEVVMGLIIIIALLFDMLRKGYIFRKPDEE